MKKLAIAGLLTSVSLFGCAADGTEDPNPNDQIDQALLAEYRAALPSMGELQATAPQASAAALRSSITAVGDTALYPDASHDIVIGINGAVSGIIQLMEQVVMVPPTVFNSETKEFVWGPWDNEDGIGFVAAYIRDAGEGEDFRYQYALLRGIDNDLAKMQPVIWGGATPDADNEDHGVGITLWDFEANRAFEEANNPDYANLVLDQGRFVALYSKGYDEKDPSAEVAFVLATFRGFVPQDKPDQAPTDLDYFYGRYTSADMTGDFLDWEAGIDVSEPADGLAENVGVRMLFLNEGTGRAEADAAGGSLAANEAVHVTECWDDSISRTYLLTELLADGTPAQSFTEGTIEGCGSFQASLSEIGIPSLDDVDPALRAALSDVATNGIPAE